MRLRQSSESDRNLIQKLRPLAASPCPGMAEGLEGWGGEALAQELLLTLKVPLTHRFTLNLSAHTAASETIRAVDKRGKLDRDMIRTCWRR